MGKEGGSGENEWIAIIQERRCKGGRETAADVMPERLEVFLKNKELLRGFGLKGRFQLQTASFGRSFGGRGISGQLEKQRKSQC